jgi:hypothetical protein
MESDAFGARAGRDAIKDARAITGSLDLVIARRNVMRA